MDTEPIRMLHNEFTISNYENSVSIYLPNIERCL